MYESKCGRPSIPVHVAVKVILSIVAADAGAPDGASNGTIDCAHRDVRPPALNRIISAVGTAATSAGNVVKLIAPYDVPGDATVCVICVQLSNGSFSI